MKFAVLKALTVPGLLDKRWKDHIHHVFSVNPDSVRQDYNDLVRSLSDLELMEKYLREEVLYLDEETASLRYAVGRANRIGALLAPVVALHDRKHGSDITTVLSDVENIAARIPGVGRTATLSGSISHSSVPALCGGFSHQQGTYTNSGR